MKKQWLISCCVLATILPLHTKASIITEYISDHVFYVDCLSQDWGYLGYNCAAYSDPDNYVKVSICIRVRNVAESLDIEYSPL